MPAFIIGARGHDFGRHAPSDLLAAIGQADLKELEEAPSMTQPAARRVYQFFHGEPENEAPGGENTPNLREKTAVPAQKPGKN